MFGMFDSYKRQFGCDSKSFGMCVSSAAFLGKFSLLRRSANLVTPHGNADG